MHTIEKKKNLHYNPFDYVIRDFSYWAMSLWSTTLMFLWVCIHCNSQHAFFFFLKMEINICHLILISHNIIHELLNSGFQQPDWWPVNKSTRVVG